MKKRKRKILIAILLALLAMAVSYFCTNLSVTISGEKGVLKYWSLITNLVSQNKKNIVPEDVLFVNVSSDKQLVDITDEIGRPVGNAAITDRQKLTDLLTLISTSGNYTYVMLDILFEEGYYSDADMALFDLIASMDRIVIPRHKDVRLASQVLEKKAAYADYSTNIKEDGFAKYPLLVANGGALEYSMPLKMYSDLSGRTVRKHGLIYTDKASLSRRVVFPRMYIQIDTTVGPGGKRTYLDMGANILNRRHDIDLHALFENKIIVIGSFTEDMHTSYAGDLSGCVINYNVFESLRRGQHTIPLILIIIYFLIFFAMSYLLLCGSPDKTQSWGWVWAKLFVIYSFVLTVVLLFVFMIWGQAHDVFITSTLFSIIDTVHKKIINKTSNA